MKRNAAPRVRRAPHSELTADSWEREVGQRAAALLAAGEFCDVHLVAGDPPERIPASKLLLAAAIPSLEQQLRHAGAELELTGISAATARGLVQRSCGERRVPSRVVLCWLCGLGVALAAYAPVWGFNLEVGGFFMDDAMIKRNPVVVGPTMDWHRLWRTDYWGLEMFDPETWTHKSFRPLVVLTFRWNYLLHGFDSRGFHATNALLHAAASAQLGAFACGALRLPWSRALLLAALFAAHPVHAESICYIVGRADLMCMLALLLALQVYRPCAQGQARVLSSCWRVPAAVALLLLAGLCKETGLTFFGVLVVWEVLGAGAWLRVVVLLAAGAAACGARVWYTSGTQIARMDPYSNPVAAAEDAYVRWLSYLLVHGIYGRLLALPTFLCYDYSMDAVPLVESLQDMRLLLPCAAYLTFVQLAVLATQSRTTALGLSIFALSFLPMTNLLFPIGTLVAERLLYMPSAGLLIAVVALAPSRAVRLALLAAVLACGVLCYRRVLDWRSVERITLVDGLKELRSSRTQFNLANLYLQESRLDEALQAYQRAIAADPLERDSMPLYHAGQILLFRGQHREAESYLHKAVSGYFSPLTLHEEEVWHDYGLALWHVGRGTEAAQNLQNAIITNPTFPKGYNNLACALVLLGLNGQAPDLVQQGLQAMEQALALVPSAPLYWRNAAALLSLAGDAQGSLRAWERYRQLDPVAAAGVEATGALPRDCTWEFYFR